MGSDGGSTRTRGIIGHSDFHSAARNTMYLYFGDYAATAHSGASRGQTDFFLRLLRCSGMDKLISPKVSGLSGLRDLCGSWALAFNTARMELTYDWLVIMSGVEIGGIAPCVSHVIQSHNAIMLVNAPMLMVTVTICWTAVSALFIP